jgi:hypothetical protein
MDTLELKHAVQDLQQRAIGRVNEVETKQRELADRLVSLEQRGGGAIDRPITIAKSLGERVVDAIKADADLLAKTGRVRFALDLKAAGDPVTTGSVRNVTSIGPSVPAAVLGAGAVLPMPSMVSTSRVEYSRYTGLEGSAGVQATEGAAKAAITPTFSIIQQDAITIAGYTKVSRQAASDTAELQRAVDNVLARQLWLAFDGLMTNGGTGFSGGLEGLATAYTSLVYTGLADAISEGVATMQTAGFAPNAVMLNPADWLAIVVAKGAGDGQYLTGNYLETLPLTLRGLRVGLSANVDAGKALLMDTAFVEAALVNSMTFEIGLDGSDFTKNLVTVLGELRVVPIFRATGAARFITPKA